MVPVLYVTASWATAQVPIPMTYRNFKAKVRAVSGYGEIQGRHIREVYRVVLAHPKLREWPKYTLLNFFDDSRTLVCAQEKAPRIFFKWREEPSSRVLRSAVCSPARMSRRCCSAETMTGTPALFKKRGLSLR
jgi:hypothetical protein